MDNKYKRIELLFFAETDAMVERTQAWQNHVLLAFSFFYAYLYSNKIEAYIVNNVSRFLRCMTIEFLVFQISPSRFKKSNKIFVEKYVSCASLCIRIVYYSVIIDGKNVRIDRMRIRKGREKEDLFKMMNTKLQPYRLYAAIIQINVASPKIISFSYNASPILEII